MPQHPMQPVQMEGGVARFKRNKIVEYLLENGILTLNDLAAMPFPDEDWRQLSQLIGYSVSGYGDLSYAEDHWTVEAADEAVEDLLARET